MMPHHIQELAVLVAPGGRGRLVVEARRDGTSFRSVMRPSTDAAKRHASTGLPSTVPGA